MIAMISTSDMVVLRSWREAAKREAWEEEPWDATLDKSL
jgi:hypothetical protein